MAVEDVNFRALNEAYDSELVNHSDTFFSVLLGTATQYNHIQLLKRMLGHPRCDLNAMTRLAVPSFVQEQKDAAKDLRSRLRCVEALIISEKHLKEGVAWRSLMRKVQSKFDPVEILREFNDFPEKSASEWEYSISFLHLLLAAQDHRHTDLAQRMSVTKYAHLRTSLVTANPPPLCCALTNKNLFIVDMFLHAGAGLTATTRLSREVIGTNDEILCVQSAVEYACGLDDPGMLRLLLAFDTNDNPERGMALHFACRYGALKCIGYLLSTPEGRAAVNVYKDFLCLYEPPTNYVFRVIGAKKSAHFTNADLPRAPLHILLKQTFADRTSVGLLQLPTAVKLLVAAGACVNNKDGNGYTPFCYLVSEIGEMTRAKRHVSKAEREAFVETARVLLAAGSHVDGPISVQALDVILHKSILKDTQEFDSFITYICSCKEALQLRAELLELLLAQRRTINRDFPYSVVLLKLAAELSSIVYAPEKLDAFFASVDWCHVLIDKLCAMLRCCLLTGPRKCNTGDSLIHLEPSFMNFFISIASYSHKSRRKRFLGLVLYALSGFQVNKVKSYLLSTLERVTNDFSDISTVALNIAIEAVSAIRTPLSLQDLARREINCAMSHRSLLESSTLAISRNQEDYVLLKSVELFV